MEKLLLPSKIEWHKGEETNQKFVTIEPCYYGYGTTLGNALRRVLLSSLPGAAVTTVKIQGVQHEFSAIPNVQEDVVEIILNLKRLRIKMQSNEPIKLALKVKGEKVVTAADFEKNPQIEITNPDLVIATLTDKKAELDMEVTITSGRGYVPTENQDKSQLAVGEIAVDSIFTPVVNVSYKVENTRVGQITDYDKLTIYIETDGTVRPEEAFSQGVDMLLEYFQILKNAPVVTEEIKEAKLKKEKKEEKVESN
jgi:DNA-directed RNA polymerase subunit alpha